jgi:predicted dehydrogenase
MPYVKLLLALLAAGACAFGADIRIGIIGTDTSHVPAFTRLFNDASYANHIPGARVVAAFKGGSKDIEDSYGRVDKFADEVKTKYGVEIVPDVATLLSKVDAVLIESVDARPHLAYAKQVIAAHKPFFVDKPVAPTLEDAREIARLAKAAGVPWFSSSTLRFGIIATSSKFPDATGVTTWGPGPTEPHHHLDLAWYAIHPIELLFTLMGTGCESVTRIASADTDVVVGKWKDGRIGTVRAIRPYSDYGAIVNRGRETAVSHPKAAEATDYQPLVREILKFFQSGKPPVAPEETMEIFAFMDAAQRSKEQGGKPVTLR